jgi:DedD protein
MAKTISEEELQLRKRARRRLIGAIALVTMVAVFLPMVLDHEPKPINQDISIRIPAPNSGTFTSKIVPVVPGTPSTLKPSSETPSKAATGTAEPVAKAPPAYDTEAAPPKISAPDKPQSGTGADVAVPNPSAKVAAKTTDKAPVEAKSSAGYVVQVAALNDVDKAKEMQLKIRGAGVASYTEVVPIAKGNVTRVRAGPFATREEAEKMRDKLKDMGLNGNIIPK